MNRLLATIMILFIGATALIAQSVDMDMFHDMTPRNIGPAGMSGRVTSIDVNLTDTDEIYIGTAAGGVWKSNNSGHTWEPIFDDQSAASIGAVAIYQANPSIIYVGSGEGNPRNSQNSGRGMFKSMDSGKTWKEIGLRDTRQIHRVIIHPNDPNTVWAGVSGATWGDSEDRGVYKTMDGGETWRKVLYTNNQTGIADLVIDPSNPNRLIAAMWEHQRLPWRFRSGGPGSGLHTSLDGGETWEQVSTDDGLPQGKLGRIGLSFAPSSPEIVYAYIESNETAIYKSVDSGLTWSRQSIVGEKNIGGRPFYYADIYVDPQHENRIYSIATEVTISDDGGKTWSSFAPGNKIHTDHHAWWAHPTDADFLMVGHDGGLNITHDRGDNWWFADNLPLAQFYHISVDNAVPYNVMGGLQDNGSWRGPSRTSFKGGIRNLYWQRLSVGDGFDVVPDPLDLNYGYAMGQAGNLVRWHAPSGHLKKIKPTHPDGTHLRFNWNTGIAIDPHDQKTIYYGSQYLHKSSNHGDNWDIISPDLTTNDTDKSNFLNTGGITSDVTGAENHCTIVSIDPSPIDKNVIWIGTDDGNVQVTQDGGNTWNNTITNISGLPAHTWAPQVTASTHDLGTAFVVFDDHRRNNWEPYVYTTSNYGKTWKRLADKSDIDGYVYSFVQDPIETSLMFVGSEFGLYVSFDSGANWNQWTQGMPTMPISDLVIHPRDHDLVIGTFGRAIWILDDIRPLREMAKLGATKLENQKIHLFTPPNEYLMIIGESIGYRHGKVGDALYNGENRPQGAMLTYAYKGDPQEATIRISDKGGNTIRTFYDKAKQGINRTNWSITKDAPRGPNKVKSDKPYRAKSGFYAPPGEYIVSLVIDKDSSEQSLTITADPRLESNTSDIAKMAALHDQHSILNNRVTAMMDDVRALSDKLALQRSLLDHADVDKKDTSYAIIDSAAMDLNRFTASVMGRTDVQGIYRDPSILSNLMGRARYMLDHVLTPVTDNHRTIMEQLTTKLEATEANWKEVRAGVINHVRGIGTSLKVE